MTATTHFLSFFLATLAGVPEVAASGPAQGRRVFGFLYEGESTADIRIVAEWSKEQGYTVEFVSPFPEGRFKAQNRDGWVQLADYALLWLDLEGTEDPTNTAEALLLPAAWTDPACRSVMLAFIKAGGTLVVAQQALRYPVDLGIENVLPIGGIVWVCPQTASWRMTADGDGRGQAGTDLRHPTGRRFRLLYRFSKNKPRHAEMPAPSGKWTDIYETVRWDVGKGRIYGLSLPLLLAQADAIRDAAASLATTIYRKAGVTPDPELAAQVRRYKELTHKLRLEQDLKLTGVQGMATVGDTIDQGPYARLTADGFVIGNTQIERRVALAPHIHTVSIWNKLTGEAIPTGSAEFRLTFGERTQSLNLLPGDFQLSGRPEISGTADGVRVTLSFQSRRGGIAPVLRLRLNYLADRQPELAKSLQVTNLSGQDLFLREVWLDALRFGETVEVIPYELFAAFARTKAGSLWLCQSLPYSVPSAGAADRYIGIAYPPCEPLAAGATYAAETSYLTAVKRSGRMHGPWGKEHQFSSYGDFGNPTLPLDLAEIESCVDFIDRHGVQTRRAFSLYHSYHDYAVTGLTNFLPYTKGPGSGLNANKEWMDLAAAYGVRTYALYPECNSWVPAAQEMLANELVPYLASLGMDTQIWFSSYSAGWYGQGLFGGREWKNYRKKEDQDYWLEHFSPLLRKYHGTSTWADQGHAFIDRAYDQSLGYPGRLPLSPHIYKEFKGWQRIVDTLRKDNPDLAWGNAHLGNAQAPLFCGINSFHYWCEPANTSCGPMGSMDRYPATSRIKAAADAYRREQYWALMERFVPLRFSLGLVNYQISTVQFTEPVGEPITQHFRYLLLANLALHPTIALWGLKSMTDRGYFGPREQSICREWIKFAEMHAEELYQRPRILAGEPGYGKVEVYSYGDRGNGWVFFINPHYLSQTVTFSVNETSGFGGPGKAGGQDGYTIQESTPYKRWRMFGGAPVVHAGDSFEIDVPAYTVVLLRLAPPDTAWAGQKTILAGAEPAPGGGITALPGEHVEWAEFDVTKPNVPKMLRSGSGVVSGGNPRIEIKQWRVREGELEDNLGGGFEGGSQVRFQASPSIGKNFALQDFTGAAIWDLAVDPVVQRGAVELSQLQPIVRQRQSSGQADRTSATGGRRYWLASDFALDQLPKQPIVYLQIAVPERATMKAWINSTPQECTKTFNDWAVLKPSGLRVGGNTLLVWMRGNQSASG